MLRTLRRYFLQLLAWLIIPAVLAACGSDSATVTPTAGSDPFARFDENSHGWEVVSDGLNAVLATPDLGVGDERFAMVLSTGEGLVRFPVVEFSTYRYLDGVDGQREGPVETKLARFTSFPLGTRGIHVTEFNFDRAGAWAVEAHVPQADGSTASAEVRFQVRQEPQAVAVGEAVPRSENRTLRDVEDVSELTTGSFYDPELYRYTVAEAVDRQRPFVVVFASPAFCTNAVCGPQVEVVSTLREMYGDSADFIHVDLFENPQEIQGDLSRAVETPLLDEWGLVSPEWTYVVAPGGVVSARFENFTGEDELSGAIEKVISAARGA